MIVSCHPADKVCIDSFKVSIVSYSEVASILSVFAYFQQIGAETITENKPVVQQADLVFVSVKPGIVPSVLNEIKSNASGKLFISVAMGVTINDYEKVLTIIQLP